MKSVHSLSQFSCTHCKKGPFNKTSLDNHIRTNHTYHPRSIPCTFDDCNLLFRFESEMIKHRVCHEDVRPLLCSMCDKAFKNSNGLKHHILVHTGERPYK